MTISILAMANTPRPTATDVAEGLVYQTTVVQLQANAGSSLLLCLHFTR
jgi:hypothetical protein